MAEATLNGRYVVVVVEDEFLIRINVLAALEEAGFDVVETKHADEAVRILTVRAREVHAVFTDVHMPGSMDGVALARLTRRSWPWIALLITSGRARPNSEELPDGSRFLPKPYHPDHVVGHLRELLAR